MSWVIVVYLLAIIWIMYRRLRKAWQYILSTGAIKTELKLKAREVQKLEQKVEELCRVITVLEEERDTEINRLIEENADQVKQNCDLANKIQKLEKENKALREVNQSIGSKYESMVAEGGKFEQEYKLLVTTIKNTVKCDEGVIIDAVGDLVSTNKLMQENLAELEQKLEKVEWLRSQEAIESNNLRLVVEKLEQKLEKVEEGVKLDQKLIDDLNELAYKRQKRIDELEEQLKVKQGDYDDLQKSFKDLSKEFLELEQENGKLRNQPTVDKINEWMQEAKNTLVAARKILEIDEDQDFLSACRLIMKALKTSIGRSGNLEKENKELIEAKLVEENYVTRIKELEQSCQVYEHDAADFINRIEKLEAKLESTKEQYSTYESNMQKMLSRYDEYKKEDDSTIENLRGEIEKLEQQLAKCRKRKRGK